MKLHKMFSILILPYFVLCVLLTSVSAKEEWTKVRSKNFQLVGNAAERDIRDAATRLEQFREVFRQLYTKVNFNSPIPISVVVFKDEKSFRDYKLVSEDGTRKDWVTGYFQKGEDTNYIVLSAEGEKAVTYRTIFHEYIHFLVDNELGRTNIPPWLNEGLAEYYKTFQLKDDQTVTLGSVNGEHLRLLQQNKLIPFDAFFNTDNYTLHKQGADGAGLFYAQAWALMHYLMQSGDGARSEQLKEFTNSVLKGEPPKKAFNDAFQADYATMERELKAYIEQKNFRTSVTTLKNKLTFDRTIVSSTISESEAKAVLGDLLYHTNRLAEATALLEEVLKNDADSSSANATLGLVKVRQGKFTEAKTYLEKAVALDDKNYLAYFQYAYALSREGMTDYGFVSGYTITQASKMRDALERAIELNPNYAESYNLLAFINIVRNEDIDEAKDYLDKALKLAPGNQWYQMHVAEVYMRKENFTNARQIAQKVYETAPNDRLRLYAKTTLNIINSFQAQLESIKNTKIRQVESDVTDKPLTEEEIARLNEKALQEAVNQNLRRLRSNEKRVLGYLSKIECRAQGIEYSIRVDNQILRLSSETFETLKLTAFDAQMADGQVGCGTLKKEMFAVVTYRPTLNINAKSAGEIVSIEFVPSNFKFIN